MATAKYFEYCDGHLLLLLLYGQPLALSTKLIRLYFYCSHYLQDRQSPLSPLKPRYSSFHDGCKNAILLMRNVLLNLTRWVSCSNGWMVMSHLWDPRFRFLQISVFVKQSLFAAAAAAAAWGFFNWESFLWDHFTRLPQWPDFPEWT